jgi:beta-aspartyl-peptidase (threonine type)
MRGRILVHGGAGSWTGTGRREAEVISSLEEGVAAGLSALKGGSAVDAVVEAVAALEESGAFAAGRGSALNLDGEMELDAGIMDGESLRAGGVAAVRSVPHPVRLARFVMERTEHVLIAGDGASRLAGDLGLSGRLRPDAQRLKEFREEKREYLARRESRWVREIPSGPAGAREGDTVGAVAADGAGRLAAATSTGGLSFKLPGRVGDSPIVGHGFYAIRGAGAASTSGIGEAISRFGLSLRAVNLMAGGMSAPDAAREAVSGLTGLFGPDTAGIILLDASGRPGIFFNTRGMAVGYGGAGIDTGAQIVKRKGLAGFSAGLLEEWGSD